MPAITAGILKIYYAKFNKQEVYAAGWDCGGAY